MHEDVLNASALEATNAQTVSVRSIHDKIAVDQNGFVQKVVKATSVIAHFISARIVCTHEEPHIALPLSPSEWQGTSLRRKQGFPLMNAMVTIMGAWP